MKSAQGHFICSEAGQLLGLRRDLKGGPLPREHTRPGAEAECLNERQRVQNMWPNPVSHPVL